MTISGYAFTILHVITSNWLINVTHVTIIIIYIYVGTRSDTVYNNMYGRTNQQISLFTSHDDGQLQLQIKVSSLSAFRSTVAGFLHQSL